MTMWQIELPTNFVATYNVRIKSAMSPEDECRRKRMTDTIQPHGTELKERDRL
jgi:hypothetical protein